VTPAHIPVPADEAAHEVASIVPFGAVLTAWERVLAVRGYRRGPGRCL
jgi:hypothetical protein